MGTSEGNTSSETNYCTNCGEIISSAAKFCPECGSEQIRQQAEPQQAQSDTGPQQVQADDDKKEPGIRHRLPGISRGNTTRRNVVTGVGYSFAGLFAIGALGGGSDESSGGGGGGSTSSSGQEQYPNAFAYNEDVGIVLRNVSASTGQVSVEITGEATNESDQDYDYAQLQFGLFDSTDAKVGDALANTSGLPAGQVWRFTATGMIDESTSSFRFESMTAY